MTTAFTETNVLMSDNAEDLFEKYEKVKIHIATIEELDDMNHSSKEDDYKKFMARRGIKLIEKYMETNQLEVVINESKFKLPESLYLDKKDNRILAMAKDLFDKDENIIFVTEDLNLILKAKSIEVPCFRWRWEKQNDDLYTGIREINLTEEECATITEKLDDNPYNCFPNEYLIVNIPENKDQYLLMWNGEYFEEVEIDPIRNKYLNNIVPLDIYQKAFIHMLQNDEVKVKITDSVYGAGKTFLMLHWALQQLDNGYKYNKLYFVKSDSPPVGRHAYPALPGGIFEKSEGLLGILCDTTSEENLNDFSSRNSKVEVLPIQFAKSRSLRKAILFITEAQDVTPSEMERLLSRIGEDTVVLLDGSTRQIDNKNCYRRNGLTVASENFKNKTISAQVNMITDFRSEVSKLVGQMDWSD